MARILLYRTSWRNIARSLHATGVFETRSGRRLDRVRSFGIVFIFASSNINKRPVQQVGMLEVTHHICLGDISATDIVPDSMPIHSTV